jgi:hypothetical protein
MDRADEILGTVASRLERVSAEIGKVSGEFLVAAEGEIPRSRREEILQRVNGARADLARAVAWAKGEEREFLEAMTKAKKKANQKRAPGDDPSYLILGI